MIKSVQESFSLGNLALFGETACNALFSICWSVVRDACSWNSVDLDYIF